jgi:hypothetical protein
MAQVPGLSGDLEFSGIRPARCWRINTGQIAVGTTTAVEIAGNNPDRFSVTITNSDGTNNIAVGDSAGVTTATGHLIPAGVSLTLSFYGGPVFVIAQTATVNVTYIEESR